jgi:hypothetical protein
MNITVTLQIGWEAGSGKSKGEQQVNRVKSMIRTKPTGSMAGTLVSKMDNCEHKGLWR